MIYLYYLLAGLLVWISFRSFRGGVRYLDHFRREIDKPLRGFTPFVSIIAPCKGLDDGLDENLRAMLEQDYPGREVIFVVDDPLDHSVPVIERVFTNAAIPWKLVIAPRSAESGQKVENLREGVTHASDQASVLVFYDSDARPSSDWLRHLVAPLEDSSVGAATGYRWFISDKPTFASELRSVWNASIASALGEDPQNNFSWGGSTAIRREVFDRLEIRERWRGTVSDDFTLARVLQEAGMPVVFVPRSLTASVGSCSFGELFEFSNRQMKITRVYAPHLWRMSLMGSGLFAIVMLWSLANVIIYTTNRPAAAVSIAVVLAVSFLSAGKALLRLRAVKLALPTYKLQLQRQFATQTTLWMIATPLFFVNSVAALLSRKVTWRGIAYELISRNETRLIGSGASRGSAEASAKS